MFLDDPGFGWIRGFQLRLEMKERQGFLHLAALCNTQIWRPQGDSNPCRRRERPVSWSTRRWGRLFLAGPLGVEPRLAESESAVLPVERQPNNSLLKTERVVISRSVAIPHSGLFPAAEQGV